MRFLRPASHTTVQPIWPERPTAPTGPRPRRGDPRAEARETWGGSSPSTGPPAAADRPRVPPRTLTEPEATPTAGPSPLPRRSIAALQPGKNPMRAPSGSPRSPPEPTDSLQRGGSESSRRSTRPSGVHHGHHNHVCYQHRCGLIVAPCALPSLFGCSHVSFILLCFVLIFFLLFLNKQCSL